MNVLILFLLPPSTIVLTLSFVHQYDTRQAGKDEIFMMRKSTLQYGQLDMLTLNPGMKLPAISNSVCQ